MRLRTISIGALGVAAISNSLLAQRGRGAASLRSDSGAYGALSYRLIGPPGNRVDAVVGVAGDPSTYYVGAASGGIWRTTDGGVHWAPIFDHEMVASIGALAVAPSNPRVVWAGTGESFIRSHLSTTSANASSNGMRSTGETTKFVAGSAGASDVAIRRT